MDVEQSYRFVSCPEYLETPIAFYFVISLSFHPRLAVFGRCNLIKTLITLEFHKYPHEDFYDDRNEGIDKSHKTFLTWFTALS